MITNPRTGNDKTEYERCVQCDAIPAHECFWLVEKGADEYRLRVTVCEKHEHECAEHMEELKKR